MPGPMNVSQARHSWSGLVSFRGVLTRLLHLSIDLIYPPRCAGCGMADTPWCNNCQQELETVAIDLHLRTISPLLSAASTGMYVNKLRDAIHAFKYNNAPHLARVMAERLDVLTQALPYTFDCLIPVPIHTVRLQQRGYNQAKVLADELARLVGIPVMHSAIIRQENTRSQVGLTMQERQDNVAGAFTAISPLAGQRVLLIDDVLTTGATLKACAQAAYDAGASFVFGLTVSHARDLASR